jgi:hypothetical protein
MTDLLTSLAKYVPMMQGALAALSFVVAMFFARMWRRARDRFYLFFAVAFAIFAVHWCSIAGHANEHTTWPYVTRLIAFVLIIAAIIDKNSRAARA